MLIIDFGRQSRAEWRPGDVKSEPVPCFSFFEILDCTRRGPTRKYYSFLIVSQPKNSYRCRRQPVQRFSFNIARLVDLLWLIRPAKITVNGSPAFFSMIGCSAMPGMRIKDKYRTCWCLYDHLIWMGCFRIW